MARARNPKREQAFEIWKESNGAKKLKDIAEELGITSSTIRKWKATDKWDEQIKGSAPIEKGSAPIRGAPKGNKNAVGNNGGAPLRNQNAITHGLFAKFLPDETLEIMEHMNERSPADLIWDQIQIQYAAIIRAQKIMLVQDKHEMIKELKKAKYEYYPRPEEEGGGVEQAVTEEEYEFQFAWDRQATFLNAQSRAMGELRSLIRQFVSISDEADERRMKLEMMNLQMDKIRADTEKVKASANNSDAGMSVMIVNDLDDDD